MVDPARSTSTTTATSARRASAVVKATSIEGATAWLLPRSLASGGRRDLVALLLHLLGVLAAARGAREARPVMEGGLCRREVRLLPAPGVERESEQGAPSEKLIISQGRPSTRLIASRWALARWSLCPPERKTTPGTAAGTVWRRQRSVRPRDLLDAGPVWTVVARHDHVGLEQQASHATRCSKSSRKTWCSVATVASYERSIAWSPSMRTSGSTIGTSPAS